MSKEHSNFTNKTEDLLKDIYGWVENIKYSSNNDVVDDNALIIQDLIRRFYFSEGLCMDDLDSIKVNLSECTCVNGLIDILGKECTYCGGLVK